VNSISRETVATIATSRINEETRQPLLAGQVVIHRLSRLVGVKIVFTIVDINVIPELPCLQRVGRMLESNKMSGRDSGIARILTQSRKPAKLFIATPRRPDTQLRRRSCKEFQLLQSLFAFTGGDPGLWLGTLRAFGLAVGEHQLYFEVRVQQVYRRGIRILMCIVSRATPCPILRTG
jgi:hypothetical protein